MNDEIKEILDNLKNKDNDIKGINFLKYQDLTRGEINLLLDYITNLQQENKIRQQDINNLAYQLAKMKEENEYLKLSNPEMNIEHFRVINENKRKIDNLRKQNKDLQQENQRLKEENNKLEIALENIQEDYDRRLEEINYLNEELEEEKRIEEADLKTIQRLEEENEKLNNLFEYNMQTLVNTDKLYEDYKSRCEKASEYIEEHIRIDDEYPDYMEMLIEERDNLLNILQNGSDSQ